MNRFVNVDAVIEKLVSQSRLPRLDNGIGIDVERFLRERYDTDIARIPELKVGNSSIQGCCLPDRSLILIEANDSMPRQRFTLAHELAHLELHYRNAGMDTLFQTADPLYFRCTISDNPFAAEQPSTHQRRRERQADIFAARFLMPAQIVRTAFRQAEDDIVACADLLLVSRQALGYRLAELGLASTA